MTATDEDVPTNTALANGDSPKAHYGKINDPRLSADEMDERRKENLAYEYLCHLEEAKIWIEACIKEDLAPTTELEESLRNGVALGKLAHFMAPDVIPIKRVYDRDQARFKARGLHFRHTDNINHWFHAMSSVGHPKIFYPETTDVYDRKNMPRVIYCIHALSLYLFKLGKAPQIQDLYGKVKFTDEEINAMRLELEKYGIQMPAFSKIGGILANEMPVDEAALHAAIIAINDAIDQQIAKSTLVKLKIEAAHLINVLESNMDAYQTTLYHAKHVKAENTKNKSLDPESSYIPDVYDELLTQAELQGNINYVNASQALTDIDSAIFDGDKMTLLECLRNPALALRNIKTDNADKYLQILSEARKVKGDNNNAGILTKDEIQLKINAANNEADIIDKKRQALEQINAALKEGDNEAIFRSLQNPSAQLPHVHQDAAPLYSFEFSNIRSEKQDDLDYDELCGGVQVLSAVASINKAIDMGDCTQTLSTLLNKEACINSIDTSIPDKYQDELAKNKVSKHQTSCDFLTHFDIQKCVNDVNSRVHDDNKRIAAVSLINDVLEKDKPSLTLDALQTPGAMLNSITPSNGVHYHKLLLAKKRQKQQSQNDKNVVLWYEEIQDTIIQANDDVKDGIIMSAGMMRLNNALLSSQRDSVYQCLSLPELSLYYVQQCLPEYYTQLQMLQDSKKQAGSTGSGWMMNRLVGGHKFYFNVHTEETAWERPRGVQKDHTLLTREEVQHCLNIVSERFDRQKLFESHESFIIRIQSLMRGCLARKRIKQCQHDKSQSLATIKIQSWWKMHKTQKAYKEKKVFFSRHEDSVIKLQSAIRMLLVRRPYLQRLEYLKSHEAAAVKIQAFMRRNWAQHDYKLLMHGDCPTLSVVRRFVHLLDQSDIDYSEEVELENLRREVVTDIRNNQKLDSDLNEMDIKIGLLVKNRLTLTEVLSQHKTLKKYRENSSSSLSGSSSHRGLKSLSKSSRARLEAYQHLFYLLQTNPAYLARLIFEMPQSKTTKFMESVILTLYNYASNQREEYLLLRLFRTALEEEISSKVDKLSDIVTGNPLVIKMIVSFNRNARGQSLLRELLNPLVTEVIENKSLCINTNPVEVYKQWINQMETESGKTSGLPYDVTITEALDHKEVRDRIDASIKSLQASTDTFFKAILQATEKLPYGMRYMAKVLYDSLHSQFPDALEKDLLKIVGNLIYYRYINSAIVAPDAFDIIDISANKGLNNDQRRNLGSIAKMLQFAASNKGFGGDSEHLSGLNHYIMESHIKFKNFFKDVCNVEEPETHFDMDQYTDVTRLTKPIIYISIAEIIETHKLLLDHQDSIAPDHSDPLHELLEDLGDSPSVDSLLGDDYIDESTNKTQMAKTEISLTLSNKFEVPEDVDNSDIKSLLIRTKRMIVDVIRCQQSGDNLVKVLENTATDHEENDHNMLIKRRDRVDERAATRKLVRQPSMLGDTRLSIKAMKLLIERNLLQLEQAQIVSSADNYQSIINSIVQDVRNQRHYRQRRKQEMNRLKQTLRSLDTKKCFYAEQIDYYNQYVKTCLDNLSTKAGRNKSKRSSLFGRDNVKGKTTIKYSAAKLHEKGIILEIEGLPTNQFKNMLFEISTTDTAGLFDINTRFMGIQTDQVEVVFQDLLQMQYEGVAVMKMFSKAKINVNLLIFMLNKKFYGK